jgi:4a-hydroxytetrahydrobiopterin dehydratase
MQSMNDDEITQRLGALSDWHREGDRLVRTFVFRDFVAAFGFMAKVALVAERMNHHPEWRNVWNRVEVELTTHDAKGITARDFELAHAMDELADQRA